MRALEPGQRACVIGAGSSGIAACQVLAARGIAFDCFEKGSAVGGNWRYLNDNGMSAAYRSLHINTSRSLMAFASYPMPEDYPDYPSHWQIAKYFDDFVDHFGLRDQIRFRTEVISVEPGAGGEWDVTVEDEAGQRETATYGAVLIANGHHWNPRWPEPPFAGSGGFRGEQMHVHAYTEPDVMAGKRVLVLGIGNSATDLAVEASRNADATFLSMRRGAYVLPKYIRGKPTDQSGSPALLTRLPIGVQRFFFTQALRSATGKMTDYGLPEPDHRLLEAHPTVSSELLGRLGHGSITVKPNIRRFDGGSIEFADGSRERIDLVIYCTGYKITFPFLSESLVSASENRIPLYRRVVSVDQPGLFFIGLVQPLGAIMPIAERQSEWVADLLEGAVELPTDDEMRREIAGEDDQMRKRYVASKRHTIQVDFYPYMRTLAKERRRGRGGVLLERLPGADRLLKAGRG